MIVDIFIGGKEFQGMIAVVAQNFTAPGQHKHIKFLVAVFFLGSNPGGNDFIIANFGPAPVPVVHKLQHGDIAPVVVMIATALQVKMAFGIGDVGGVLFHAVIGLAGSQLK